MNVAERSIAPEGKAAANRQVRKRAPPTAVNVLLPLGGLRYTPQFLEFCLPTLLAPGNVPALAQALPCTIVVMTSQGTRPSSVNIPPGVDWPRFAGSKFS